MKNRKNLDFWDIGLIKLSVVAITLFVITIWSAAMDWIHSVNSLYFLVAFVVIVVRPFYRYYMK